jgi:hypothetical protein
MCVFEEYPEPKPECAESQYYDEPSNSCLPCGENCQSCAAESGVCEACFPATSAGHFAIDPNDSKRCAFHEVEEEEPVPTCTSNEYYMSADNSCYPCGQGCVTCAAETGVCG